MVNYTEKLLEKGADRKRLTRQLATLVGTVANDIAHSLPEGTRPISEIETWMEGTTRITAHPWWSKLEVIIIRSNIGEAKFLALFDFPHSPKKPAVFVPDKEPGSRFFLDNDPRSPVWVASAKEYLKFANVIPQIAAGFEMKADELNKELREAFDELKEIASTEAVSDNVGYESVQKRRFGDFKGAF